MRKRLVSNAKLAFLAGIFSWVGLFAPNQVRAQVPAAPRSVAWPPELVGKLEKLRDAALSNDYAWKQLAHLTENIGPRISGSPQAQHAVEYLADEMRKQGFEVKLEKVMVPHWVRGEERGILTVFPGQAPGTTQKIVLTALGNSAATPADGLEAEVVVVNTFDELTSMGRGKVAGRIVLFNEKYDKHKAAQGDAGDAYGRSVQYREFGAKAAKELGAAASLVRSVGNADFRLPHTGDSIAAGIPSGAVSAEDADLIADLSRQGRVVMHLELTPKTLPDVASDNVIADLRGSEHPEQIVIVSGHLDSWDLGTGAMDDGAGVVIAMQTLHLCKELGLRPKRTLRFIAWMNEESSGTGSQTYVAEHKSEFANHVGAIESDLGSGHPVGLQGSFIPRAEEVLQPLARILAPIGADILRANGNSGEDVSEMGRAGVPAFGLMQDSRTYFSYHHTAADTLDKIDPQGLAENCAVMAVMAYALADMEEPLPR